MIYLNPKGLAKVVGKAVTHPAMFVVAGVGVSTLLYPHVMLVILSIVLSLVLFFCHAADFSLLFAAPYTYSSAKDNITWLTLRAAVILPVQLVLIHMLIYNTEIFTAAASNRLFTLASIYTILWGSILAARACYLYKGLNSKTKRR